MERQREEREGRVMGVGGGERDSLGVGGRETLWGWGGERLLRGGGERDSTASRLQAVTDKREPHGRHNPTERFFGSGCLWVQTV